MSKRKSKDLEPEEQEPDLLPPTKYLQLVTEDEVGETSSDSELSPANSSKRVTIIEEVRVLEEHYAAAGLSLLKDLAHSRMTVREFNVTVSFYDGESFYRTPILNYSINLAEGSPSIKEYLSKMHPYMTIFHTNLLEVIVEEYSENPDTRALLDEYLKLFQSFVERVKLCDFAGMWVGMSSTSNICEIELETSWGGRTLKDLDDLLGYFSENIWQFKSANIREGSNDLVLVLEFVDELYFSGDLIRHFEIQRILVNGHDVMDSEFVQTTDSLKEAFTLPNVVTFGFDKATGTNVCLSNNGLHAATEDDSEYAIVYGSKPLQGTAEFEIEITMITGGSDKDFSCLKFGLQQIEIGSRKLDKSSDVNSCIWEDLGSHCDTRSKDAIHITDVMLPQTEVEEESDRLAIGLQLTRDGDLSFYGNGTHKMLAAKNVYRKGYEVYPILEFSNGYGVVKITRAVMSITLQDRCLNVIAKSLHVSADVRLLPLPKKLKDTIEVLCVPAVPEQH